MKSTAYNFRVSTHARQRIAERFGIGRDDEQDAWLAQTLAGEWVILVDFASGTLHYVTTDAWLVIEGDTVVTVWRHGESEEEAVKAA